eukprot:scaffold84108_cov27-Tisochrysis_lutea.AAC.7
MPRRLSRGWPSTRWSTSERRELQRAARAANVQLDAPVAVHSPRLLRQQPSAQSGRGRRGRRPRAGARACRDYAMTRMWRRLPTAAARHHAASAREAAAQREACHALCTTRSSDAIAAGRGPRGGGGPSAIRSARWRGLAVVAGALRW